MSTKIFQTYLYQKFENGSKKKCHAKLNSNFYKLKKSFVSSKPQVLVALDAIDNILKVGQGMQHTQCSVFFFVSFRSFLLNS